MCVRSNWLFFFVVMRQKHGALFVVIMCSQQYTPHRYCLSQSEKLIDSNEKNMKRKTKTYAFVRSNQFMCWQMSVKLIVARLLTLYKVIVESYSFECFLLLRLYFAPFDALPEFMNHFFRIIFYSGLLEIYVDRTCSRIFCLTRVQISVCTAAARRLNRQRLEKEESHRNAWRYEFSASQFSFKTHGANIDRIFGKRKKMCKRETYLAIKSKAIKYVCFHEQL